MATKQHIRITLVRSSIHCLPRHKATVRGLGLRRKNHCVEIEDTPCVRCMIAQVAYLLKVEEFATKKK